MSKFANFLLGTMMLWQCTAEAALPPLAQTRREVLAILSDNQFTELLSMADIIEDIKRIDGGYLITTQREQMLVEVIPLQKNRIGPIEFELKFHPPVPLGDVTTQQPSEAKNHDEKGNLVMGNG